MWPLGRRQGVGILGAALAGLFLLEWTLPGDLILLPFAPIPVVMAATFAQPRQVTLLSVEAFSLVVVSGTHHSIQPSQLFPPCLVSLGILSLLAIQMATRRQSLEKRRQELSQLRACLHSLPDPQLVLRSMGDADGTSVDFTLQDANAAACNDFQQPKAKLLGQRMGEVRPSLPASGWLALVADVVRSQRSVSLDGCSDWQVMPDRPLRHFDIHAVPMDQDSLLLTWRDVSERIAAQRRIADAERQYRLLEANCFDVVLRLEAGRISLVSPSLTPLLGWMPEEWIGRKITDFLDPLPVSSSTTTSSTSSAGKPWWPMTASRPRTAAGTGSKPT